MRDFTASEYKEKLEKAGYSKADIDKAFGNMPGDSTNGKKTVDAFLNNDFRNKYGKDPSMNLRKGLESNTLVKSTFSSVPIAGSIFSSTVSELAARDIRLDQGKFSFLPSNVQGYGQGFKGSVQASRAVHAGNFFKHMPLVSPSSWDALANSFGVLTPTQKLQSQNGGRLIKAMNASIPLGVAGFTMHQFVNGADPIDIAATNTSFAMGVTGFRMGKALGGALTPTGSIAGRAIGIASMGTLGFAAGMLGTQAVFDSVKDLTSNESEIAKTAKKIYTRSSIANTQNSRDSLTLRQRTLNKLSNSGLNDRGTLLGNEAMVMKNLM